MLEHNLWESRSICYASLLQAYRIPLYRLQRVLYNFNIMFFIKYEPWGTPLKTSVGCDNLPQIETVWLFHK